MTYIICKIKPKVHQDIHINPSVLFMDTSKSMTNKFMSTKIKSSPITTKAQNLHILINKLDNHHNLVNAT